MITCLKHILLVEDDPKLGPTIQQELMANGYIVDLAVDGNMAISLFNINIYNIILLDINVPYIDGWELCLRFRKQSKTIPIIMLTALGELQDKIDAFENGADDYLIKPFHFNELLARIKVFLKRSGNSDKLNEVLTLADLEMSIDTKEVKRAGKPVLLTVKEFTLLELLIRNKGRVISKAEIAEKVWNINFDTGTNTIEVYINFLRNKVDKPFDKQLIFTKIGFGYFVDDIT
ncbi:transcriptional regulator [Bacteroidetes bacterium UKL13-3]|jgi:two-component system copper resistance phosphate regulon response regulator CusR|nr:transcriptional regulator [Bacteroidetes bacterium UKL13-3]HCP93028.1 DNA-binding response regulator [Bacteroidota bacterium]